MKVSVLVIQAKVWLQDSVPELGVMSMAGASNLQFRQKALPGPSPELPPHEAQGVQDHHLHLVLAGEVEGDEQEAVCQAQQGPHYLSLVPDRIL